MVGLISLIKKIETMEKILKIILTLILFSLTGLISYLFIKDRLENIVIILPLIFGVYLVTQNLFKND